jgi:hypothetical protein
LPVQFPAEGAPLAVEQLDDMEVVEDMHRPGQVVADGADVGLAHVGGHRRDLGAGRAQAPPERLQGVDALAVADEHDRPGDEVEHDGEVAVALADGDLVDGDLLELAELRLAEAALQRLGLDVLDRVPANAEVVGHVLGGHELRQFQDVALEGAGVALLGLGEGDLDLADRATGEAKDAGHLELDEGRLAADGQRAEGAFDAALVPDVGRAALGAAEPFAGLFDAEGHLALLERLADFVVAADAEGMVQ